MPDVKVHNFTSLQLLRGIAAVLVVFYHGTDYQGFLSIFQFGYSGVDLFFVLSGFIIFYKHYSDFGKKDKLIPYIQKRLLRIYPLYFVVTMIYLVVVLPFSDFSIEYIIKSFLLLPQEKDPILGVAWSLQNELLFYFIFSLFILNKKIIFPLFISWVFFIIIFNVLFNEVLDIPLIRLMLSSMNIEFLLGCLIAYLVVNNKFQNLRWITTFGITTLVLLMVLDLLDIWNLHRVIFWGIPCSIIIFGVVRLEINNSLNIKIPKICIVLGDASYSIYLTHLITLIVMPFIIKRIDFINDINNGTIELITCIIAIFVGCIFYFIVEKPQMIYLRKKFIKQKTNDARVIRVFKNEVNNETDR
ncbi:acyltransferase family protein [Peribacillus sp. NPDC046944]|uniref:acyltransferase family protein n=1 Tax=unclassified Peribacillus TaxID=2675266 RepID=UPI003D013321